MTHVSKRLTIIFGFMLLILLTGAYGPQTGIESEVAQNPSQTVRASSTHESGLQATVNALQTQVATLQPTQVPSETPKHEKILYGTHETGDHWNMWLINEDGSEKTQINLPKNIISGPAIVSGPDTHSSCDGGLSTECETTLPANLLGLYFVPSSDMSKSSLISVDYQGKVTELGSGFLISETFHSDAWFSKAGKILFMRSGPRQGEQSGNLYLIKTDGSGMRTFPGRISDQEVDVYSGYPCSDETSVILGHITATAAKGFNWTVDKQNLDGSARFEIATGKSEPWLEIDPDCSRLWLGTEENGYRAIYLIDNTGSKRQIIQGVSSAEMAPDYRHMMFPRVQGDEWKLYTASVDGKQIVELKTDYIPKSTPQVREEFSADGKRILFIATDERSEQQILYIASADGSNKRALLKVVYHPDPTGYNPQSGFTRAELSKQGDWIVAGYRDAGVDSLYLLNADGRQFKLPVKASSLYFSPSEKLFGFEVDNHYYVGDPATQKWQEFFNGNTKNGQVAIFEGHLLFSPDEKRFTFCTLKEGQIADGVYAGDSDTGQVQKISDVGCAIKWLSASAFPTSQTPQMICGQVKLIASAECGKSGQPLVVPASPIFFSFNSKTTYLLDVSGKLPGFSEQAYYRIYEPVTNSIRPLCGTTIEYEVKDKIVNWTKIEPVTSCTEGETAPPQPVSSCTESMCTPRAVLFARYSHYNKTNYLPGCMAYIDIEEEALGGGVQSVSFLQPLREIPGIGAAVDSIPATEAIILGEKWAVEVVKVLNSQQTFLDAAWVVFVDLAVKAGGDFTNGILSFNGLKLSKSEAIQDATTGLVLDQIADALNRQKGDWVSLSKAPTWKYADLYHYADYGTLVRYPNYKAFSQEYPNAFKYLTNTKILFCPETSVGSGNKTSSDAKPATRIDVQANVIWQDTGISISTGDRIKIAYISGQWSIWLGVDPLTDGNGQTGRQEKCQLMPQWNLGSLIGRVGQGKPFFIGNGTDMHSNSSGALQLSMNDCSNFSDNGGYLTVEVSTGR